MGERKKVQVTIDGRRLTIMGNESEEYMRSISTYINGKIAVLRQSPASRGLNPALFMVLTAVNITDEYFKEQSASVALGEDLQRMEEEKERLLSQVETLQTQLDAVQELPPTEEAEEPVDAAPMEMAADEKVSAQELPPPAPFVLPDSSELARKYAEQSVKLTTVTKENEELKEKVAQMRALISQMESMERPVEIEELQAENLSLRQENDSLRQMIEDLEESGREVE